jgi:hypothetical protein
MTMRRLVRRPVRSLACAALLLALATGAASAEGAVRPAGRLPATWSAEVPPGVAVLPGLASQVGVAPSPAPLRVRSRAIALDAPVVPVGASGRTLVLPRREGRVGWFRHGPAPGAPRGTAVLLAHVRTTSGPGPFASLRRLEPGQRVRIDRVDGSTTAFRVVARRRYRKDELPVSRLFAPDQRPLLVLITCGGPVEGGHYRDNVVVVAEPV